MLDSPGTYISEHDPSHLVLKSSRKTCSKSKRTFLLRDLSRNSITYLVQAMLTPKSAQPRSEIWKLFDHVLLLAKGSPLYSGQSSRCLAYFESHGHVLPPFVNPAEFLIDLAAIDTRSPEAEESSATRVQGLIQAFETSPENTGLQIVQKETSIGPVGSIEGRSRQHHATLRHQIRVLTGRTLKTTYRDPLGIAGSMLEATSMAVITGWIFLQLDGSLSGIRSREGSYILE